AWLGTDRDREGRPSTNRSLPALELRVDGTLDRKLQAALHHPAERNVGDGEAIERKPVAPGEVAMEYFELGEKIGALRVEIGGALGGRLFCVIEHRNIRRVQRAEQPIHPTFHHGAFGGCRSRQRWSMHHSEIAKDRVRFPDHQNAVDEGWYFRVRIELAVLVSERITELTPVILADVRNAQLLQTEHDLLDVSGCLSAKQSNHVILPVFRFSRGTHTCLLAVTGRAAYRRWRPSRFWC